MAKHKVGDRVCIVASDHPWSGASGEIVGTFNRAGLAWRVRLGENTPYGYPGQEVAVADDDIRFDRRRSRV